MIPIVRQPQSANMSNNNLYLSSRFLQSNNSYFRLEQHVRRPPMIASYTKSQDLPTKPKYWFKSFALDLTAKEPIEIIVQYVDVKDGNRIWAIQSYLEGACIKLFNIINNYCVKNKDKLVQANEINVNDVFAAMYQDNTYYRVQILEIMDPGLTQVCYLMVLFCFFSFCNFGFFSSYIRYVFV
jgi:hypothetical protein